MARLKTISSFTVFVAALVVAATMVMAQEPVQVPPGCKLVGSQFSCFNATVGLAAPVGDDYGLWGESRNSTGVYGTGPNVGVYGRSGSAIGNGGMGVLGWGGVLGVEGQGITGVYGEGTQVGVSGAGTFYGVLGHGDVANFVAQGNGIGFVAQTTAGAMNNFAPIPNPLDLITAMNPGQFDWIPDSTKPGRHDIGLKAEELVGVLPEVVAKDPQTGNVIGVDYGRMTAVLVAALQQLTKSNAELQARIVALENAAPPSSKAGPRPQ
jgi:hypothetical protein